MEWWLFVGFVAVIAFVLTLLALGAISRASIEVVDDGAYVRVTTRNYRRSFWGKRSERRWIIVPGKDGSLAVDAAFSEETGAIVSGFERQLVMRAIAKTSAEAAARRRLEGFRRMLKEKEG